MTEFTDSLLYAPGYDAKSAEEDPELISDAVKAAKQAEAAIVFVGLPSIYESEAFDRTHLNLPSQHNQLIQAVSAANPNTVVVLSNGAPVSMPWLSAPKAVLEGYLAGQAGGTAIADILFGAANPSGKLAETFPWAADDVLAGQWFPGKHRQVPYCERLSVGYRQYASTKTPVMFPFGFGLSYTTFAYANPKITVVSQDPIEVSVSIDISNTGNHAGAETVQVYVHDKEASVYRPEIELAAFDKVHLEPGAQATLEFSLNLRAFAFYDTGHDDWVVEPGKFDILIGASSEDVRASLEIELDGTQMASHLARHGSPVNYLELLNESPNEAFAQALGYAIPDPEPTLPYHLNSSVGELTQTWLGRKVRQKIIANFLQGMGANSNDKTLNKMMMEMANNMPLRGIAMFSRGKLPFHTLEMIIAVLNGEFGKAMKIWAQNKISTGSRPKDTR